MRTCWGKASWRRQSRIRWHSARQLDLSRKKFCARRTDALAQPVGRRRPFYVYRSRFGARPEHAAPCELTVCLGQPVG